MRNVDDVEDLSEVPAATASAGPSSRSSSSSGFPSRRSFYLYGVLRNEAVAIRPATLIRDILIYIVSPSEPCDRGRWRCDLPCDLCDAPPVRRCSLWSQLLVTVFGAALGAACFSVAVSVLCLLFGLNWPAPTLRWFVIDTVRWFAPFGLWSGVSLAVTYNTQVRERERRLALLQAQTQQAHMRALRYQVNPHLLYNTLNSIAALNLDKQNDVAEAMVVRLSDFFRASLSIDPHADVDLVERSRFSGSIWTSSRCVPGPSIERNRHPKGSGTCAGAEHDPSTDRGECLEKWRAPGWFAHPPENFRLALAAGPGVGGRG